MFDEKIINAIKKIMISNQETVAVAESVTSGLLQFAFANAIDASLFFQGGISAYNVGQKVRHLNVEPIHAIASNCVSEKVAEQMALHACLMFRSDWGISVTGYAAPVPESDDALFAYYAIAYKGAVLQKKKLQSGVKAPQEIQFFYVEKILKDFYSLLKKKYN